MERLVRVPLAFFELENRPLNDSWVVPAGVGELPEVAYVTLEIGLPTAAVVAFTENEPFELIFTGLGEETNRKVIVGE
jgi:hypothetical protein